MSWAKRAASASTATRQRVLGRDAIAADQLQRDADELVVVEEEHVGVEDLGLVLAGGGDRTTPCCLRGDAGRAQLDPRSCRRRRR